MKVLIIILAMLLSGLSLADEVKVEVNPPRPVMGEVFQAYFRIFTDSDEEPVVNFSPSGIEVVGKSNQGVSTRTIYANGKLTVTRELTLVYDLVAGRAGINYLRDINVQLGNKTIRHPSVSVNVLKEPEVLADVFVMADVPKKELYVGEGFVARYYLYSKVPVSNLDIKKYPKLDHFLKRFLQEPERTERVSVDGQLYMRTQIYAAKLFPEKVGEFKVDSLHLSATYPSSRPNDPFGAFGLNRDYKTRTMQSETIKVLVKPLPEPVPPHFTGLVGNHQIDLQVGQSKLIVNEPLEVKLTITGNGALENLEAPELIKHQGLEEFESNGDLKITDAEQATKVFDYTFLAKENLQIPAKTITLSYFDPNSGKYVPTQLNFPEIVVAGSVASDRKTESNKPDVQESPKEKKSLPERAKELAGPITIDQWQWKTWLPYLNLGLGALALMLVAFGLFKQKNFSGIQFKGEVPKELRSAPFKFNEFVRWMSPLIQETGKSPIVIIRESPLPEESKRYFIDLLSANDYKDYSAKKSEMQFKYQSGHFKELGRYIESVRNANSSQPS